MSVPATVHVVIGSRGEYSDRMEWVAGVFTDPERAKALAVEKLRESREIEALAWEWDRRRREVARPVSIAESLWARLSPNERDAAWRAKHEAQDAAHAAFVAANGECPEPEGGFADDFFVVAVPLDTWGRWEAHELPKDGDGQ